MSVGQRAAIIDIGSNSVRLVVYGGPARAPFALFNEKLLAGLGRGLASGGALPEDAMAASLKALARFRQLLDMMGVRDIQVVATAAAREASNGPDFLRAVHDLGFEPIVLSGAEEAEASGYGVVSMIPDADGIAGDLGGGSLELVRLRRGLVRDRVSLPLGSLRLPDLRAEGSAPFARTVAKMLKGEGWLKEGQGKPLFMVGGSWRALARLHMHKTRYPLPILANYEIPTRDAGRLVRMTSGLDKSTARAIPTISTSRLAGLNDAAALLAALTRAIQPSHLVTCANGLREGLLFKRLSARERARDPLLEEARAEGGRQGRFDEHGRLIHSWIAPLFAGETRAQARIREAACLLADVAWQANPEFRAERGVDMALHGNWTGASHQDRALLAMALHATFGGGEPLPGPITQLAPADDLAVAKSWGLAIRLGQRLSGGTAEALEYSRLTREGEGIVLTLAPSHQALGSDQVKRRLKSLANQLGQKARIVTRPID
ncbi:MAG: Ppx/GppA family phosphatase [Chakrabartia sp.]